MLQVIARCAVLVSLSLLAPTTTWAALPDGQVPVAPSAPATAWTAYGYTIQAPASMWPMLELLHQLHFDWQLASAQQGGTAIGWTDLPVGTFGQYDRSSNVVNLSTVLQTSSVEARTAFLAHELTHVNDEVNGRLDGLSSAACYEAEVRAFENEANFWEMLFGPRGKMDADPIEARENAKMWAFVGNAHFADLVVRTTPSYVRECGRN
jgi:hypothetical protein